MAVYSLKTVQKIPVAPEKAWDFFSNPANLKTLTPPVLDFRVLNGGGDGKMYAGQIIEYKVKPLWGISVYWMTEITQVEEGNYFIDEQRQGPYAFWHHQHHFKKIEGGVEMTDIVHYKNPFWIFGTIANKLFVKKELGRIFDFRCKKVEELFGSWE